MVGHKNRGIRNFYYWFLWGIGFVVAYTQSPLYTSNQNQYFLHGLAKSGLGLLTQDWLANTYDPTPVFSWLVAFTARYLHPVLFYFYYAFLIGLYFWILVRIISNLAAKKPDKLHLLLFTSVLLVVHSAGWRFALTRLLGADWGYIIEDGFAGQRLLGTVFQPSSFGVLLLVSIYFFLEGHPNKAVIASGLAATFHPTYLLSAAALTIAYLWSMYSVSQNYNQYQRFVKVAKVGGLALLAVSPILLYTYFTFSNVPTGSAEKAREILVNFRIPHHALVGTWFGWTSIIKITWLSAAIYISRKTPLFLLLLIPTILGLSFTLIQIFTQSNLLALIFPWRLSTFLIPLSTGIICYHLVELFLDTHFIKAKKTNRLIVVFSYLLITLAIFTGATRMVLDFQRQPFADDRKLFDFINANKSSEGLYLIPVKMQDFRLATGMPVFVDFKSIPYRNSDVLEWFRRIKLANSFYENPACDLLTELVNKENITHYILPTENSLKCPGTNIAYRDGQYTVYRVYLKPNQ